MYEKVYASPRPPSKISLKHDWMKELGSEVVRQPEGEVAQQPDGEVARQAKSSQPIQPIIVERRDPMFAQKEPRTRKSKHFPLVIARTSIQKKKQITIERRDPLCAHNQSVQC